nr:MAG TPA: hypothetical protein [Caudoviricetes sp.]
MPSFDGLRLKKSYFMLFSFQHHNNIMFLK